MKKIVALLVLMVLFFSGCTSLPNGEVCEKNHTPACATTMLVSTGQVTVPMTQVYPDQWEVKIKKWNEAEEKYNYECFEVTEEQYNRIQIGDIVENPDYKK